jgi:hypothetical protein
MDTDATALRYYILNIAPLNRVCTALKAEATPTLTFVLFSIGFTGRVRIQVQLRYFSRRVKNASDYPDGRGSSLFGPQSVPGDYCVS